MNDNLNNTYEGWSNVFTWAVNLYISNDRYSYDHWLDLAKSCYIKAHNEVHVSTLISSETIAVMEFAQALKDYLNDANPLATQSSLFSDLMSNAISLVDTYEIAQCWITEVKNMVNFNEEMDEICVLDKIIK